MTIKEHSSVLSTSKPKQVQLKERTSFLFEKEKQHQELRQQIGVICTALLAQHQDTQSQHQQVLKSLLLLTRYLITQSQSQHAAFTSFEIRFFDKLREIMAHNGPTPPSSSPTPPPSPRGRFTTREAAAQAFTSSPPSAPAQASKAYCEASIGAGLIKPQKAPQPSIRALQDHLKEAAKRLAIAKEQQLQADAAAPQKQQLDFSSKAFAAPSLQPCLPRSWQDALKSLFSTEEAAPQQAQLRTGPDKQQENLQPIAKKKQRAS